MTATTAELVIVELVVTVVLSVAVVDVVSSSVDTSISVVVCI